MTLARVRRAPEERQASKFRARALVLVGWQGRSNTLIISPDLIALSYSSLVIQNYCRKSSLEEQIRGL